MRELDILCLEGSLVSPKWAQKMACAALYLIFSLYRSGQQIVRKVSIQAEERGDQRDFCNGQQ